ncbi:MAG TPA: hypothetical protein PLG90_12495 [Ignavibacteria bacterium]|nr:hypothetical protein [Ignavibacteria bacterium]
MNFLDNLSEGLPKDIFTFILILLIVLIHINAHRLFYFKNIHKKFWISFAGGISVAYVFVHIFPELATGQNYLKNLNEPLLSFFDYHIYLISLAGFMIFYGIEHYAYTSRKNNDYHNQLDTTENHIYFIHTLLYFLFNFLIAYIIADENFSGTSQRLLFWFAMFTHLLIVDYNSFEYHRYLYNKYTRWVFSAAIISGWFVGVLFNVHHAVMLIMFAFLSGGIILNIIREEIPEQRQSNYIGFLTGAIVYSIILIFI